MALCNLLLAYICISEQSQHTAFNHIFQVAVHKLYHLIHKSRKKKWNWPEFTIIRRSFGLIFLAKIGHQSNLIEYNNSMV